MAGIAPRIFWSKGYALMPSATKTIDMALPSFIKQVLLLNSFSCLFLYSYLICKLLFYIKSFTLFGFTLKGGGGMVKTNTFKW